ncbi:MAG: 50S ribosomal protein L11 methyltransferase [Candidatus Lernaella stagnicola]|nr:50S ribosomal protein L11 methyltransferase [Candidatus Lernaella stagnicola]
MNQKTEAVLYRLIIDVPAEFSDWVAAELFEVGLRGLEEQDTATGKRLIVYGDERRQIDVYAAQTERIVNEMAEFEPAIRTTTITIDEQQNADWATAWMKHFKQTPLTPTLVVQPSWEDLPAPPGKRRLIIEPKMAFGFGTHATTQLAARSVERYVREHPGIDMLDVGTGTGLLSLVAVTVGAHSTLGIDIDQVAIDCARDNAVLNKLEDRCSFAREGIEKIVGPYAFVVANITTPTIVEMLDELERLTAPGGRLALTGILAAGKSDALLPFLDRGFDLVGEEEQDEWTLLELTRR